MDFFSLFQIFSIDFSLISGCNYFPFRCIFISYFCFEPACLERSEGRLKKERSRSISRIKVFQDQDFFGMSCSSRIISEMAPQICNYSNFGTTNWCA